MEVLVYKCTVLLFLGRKEGLQHVGQCEQQLNDIIKSCLQRKQEEEINRQKERSENKPLSQKMNG